MMVGEIFGIKLYGCIKHHFWLLLCYATQKTA